MILTRGPSISGRKAAKQQNALVHWKYHGAGR